MRVRLRDYCGDWFIVFDNGGSKENVTARTWAFEKKGKD
jgi:hypothetical protein